MDLVLVLSLLLSCVIGFALGVFGGGGSMLAVPMLVFVTRVAPSAAVGMSLAIVGATSLVAGYAHHRRGQVRLEVALLFGGAGVLTAFLGARLTHLVAGNVLMLWFAALMILVGGWMLKGARQVQPTVSRDENATGPRRPRMVQALLAGAVVGGITGFLGVGGGFLVVPALIAFAGLDMRAAVGTSLLVIAINSAAGFVGHLGTGALDLGLVAPLTIAAVLGAVVGEQTGRAVSMARLRRGFAAFVIAMGIAVAASCINGGVADVPTTRDATTSWQPTPSAIHRPCLVTRARIGAVDRPAAAPVVTRLAASGAGPRGRERGRTGIDPSLDRNVELCDYRRAFLDKRVRRLRAAG